MSQDDNYFDDLDEHLEYAEQDAQEEKIDGYIDEAKKQILEDDDFLHKLKTLLTDDSNYLHSAIDSKYSKIEILRDKKKHIYIQGTFKIEYEGVDILGLKREYPNSEIKIVNYEGKIQYVEIVERRQIEKTV